MSFPKQFPRKLLLFRNIPKTQTVENDEKFSRVHISKGVENNGKKTKDIERQRKERTLGRNGRTAGNRNSSFSPCPRSPDCETVCESTTSLLPSVNRVFKSQVHLASLQHDESVGHRKRVRGRESGTMACT